jgi:hypothetical protein
MHAETTCRLMHAETTCSRDNVQPPFLFAYVQAEANFEFEGLAWGRERQGHVRACDVQAEMNSMWRDARCVPPDTPRLFALLPQIVLANLVSGDAAYRGNLGGHGTQYMHDSVVSTPCDDELAACADEDDAASASSSSPASNSRHRTLSIAPATLAANDCILICEALRKFESGARVIECVSRLRHVRQLHRDGDTWTKRQGCASMWGAVGMGLAKLLCVWANVPTQHTYDHGNA